MTPFFVKLYCILFAKECETSLVSSLLDICTESLFEDKKVFGVIGHSEKENINAVLKNETPFYQIGDLELLKK